MEPTGVPDHYRVDTAITELPSSPVSDEPESPIRRLPRVRGDPKFEATTQSRRISVANPQSIKYNGPHPAPIEEDSSRNSSVYEDDGGSHSPSLFEASNELGLAQHLAADPSVSDYPQPIHAQNYQPIHQPLDDEDEVDGGPGDRDRDDSAEPSPAATAERKDPFALLGQKQDSLPHPDLERIDQDEKQQREIDELKRRQHAQNQNQFAPAAMLPLKHFKPRHSSSRLNLNNPMAHSRSRTAQIPQIPAINRAQTLAADLDPKSRRKIRRKNRSKGTSQSVSMDFSNNNKMMSPPSGPDLTLLCLRIENRSVLQDILSADEFAEIQHIFKDVMTSSLQTFSGYCAEHHDGHVFDALCVFNDVYFALRAAIHIQMELNSYQWPSFYHDAELRTQQMSYVGRGDQGAFNGLRVGMGLHSATVGATHNQYDKGKESLDFNFNNILEFDATYKGSAVQLVKGLCTMSFGGEILATKAAYDALISSKQGGDDISVQSLGSFFIEHVRSVKLMQFNPQQMPSRTFPPHKQRAKSTFADIAAAPINHYDPFPSSHPERKQNGVDLSHLSDGDRLHGDNDDGYGTTKEIDSEDDRHSVHSHHSHSSDNDEHQHNPRISQPRRRPSITQFTTGPNSKIEISFTGGDEDEDYDVEPMDDHKSYSNASHSSNTGYLEVTTDPYAGSGGVDSDYSMASIEPPRPNAKRNKAKEIERRKSGINRNDLPFRAPDLYEEHSAHSVHSKASSLKSAQSRGSRGSKTSKSKKRKRKKRKLASNTGSTNKSGRDGDDERAFTPQPGDSDHEENVGKINEPKRRPRRNKKQEHMRTMVDIEFNPNAPHNDDSSVYSAGSRGSTSIRSRSAKIMNPVQQLKLYKVRPNDLPADYSEDDEYTCLCCQLNKKWTEGVWRVPMWPSFDVCTECATKELQSGTSKKEIPNFDPTQTMNSSQHGAGYILSTQQGILVDPRDGIYPPIHRKVKSNAPLLGQLVDDKEEVLGDGMTVEYRMDHRTLHMLRKKLSEIIENLSNEKLKRLDSLSKWAENDADFDDFRATIQQEHQQTEDELTAWRKDARHFDDQEQRVNRRQNPLNQGNESPNTSDEISDDDLHQNWRDYDYKEDFQVIHARLKDLDKLFWHEDEFFIKRMKKMKIEHTFKVKRLQDDYAQTTDALTTRNHQLAQKIERMLNSAGGDEQRRKLMEKSKSPFPANPDIEDYDTDDDDNENTARYGKYVPPSVKHILEASIADSGQHGGNPHLERKIKEQQHMIDNYIDMISRKEAEMNQIRQSVKTLQEHNRYLENMDNNEEQYAKLFSEMERTKRENVELQNKLNFRDNDNLDEKDIESPDERLYPPPPPVDAALNAAKLKTYETHIENLRKEMATVRDENDRLMANKMTLLRETNLQMESMRDEMQSMAQLLVSKEQMVRHLVHRLERHKEGYVPDQEDEKTDTRFSWSNALGMGGPIKRGMVVFGRSKFSTPVHTLDETKRSKIDLAKTTALEIGRLREIIRVLSAQQTQNGDVQLLGATRAMRSGH